MNELRVFQNSEFGELGIMLIDGKEYFPASACARMLGYTNPRKAIGDHCRCVTKRDAWVETGVTADGNPAMRKTKVNYIPEGDLYRLIVHSRLPAAERFERWVFDEVLPAIRKHGSYAPDMAAVISQAVQAAVSETVRALAPMLGRLPKPTQRVRRRITSLVEQLEPPLRVEMEEMILNPGIGYVRISEHFREQYGVIISKSSIGRYAQRLFDMIEAQENAEGQQGERA